ncbi:MAG: SDR family oxidoreductase [Pseudomonadota bacterium]
MSQERILLCGASRGIGAAVAQHLADRGAGLISVSRTPAVAGHWVQADLSTPEGIATTVAAVGSEPLDALLYLGGVWETGAFTEAYDFQESPDAESRFLLAVNLVAPIELVKALAGNLAAAPNPRVIAVGSTSGLENRASPEVANTASKFGLRGALQALRLALRGRGIAFTLLNPANVATDEVLADIEDGSFSPQEPIPLSDLIASINLLLSLSPASEVIQLDIGQRWGGQRA